jgi:hypothetical protein
MFTREINSMVTKSFVPMFYGSICQSGNNPQ